MLLSLKKKKQTRTGGAGGAAGARRVDPGLLRVTKGTVLYIFFFKASGIFYVLHNLASCRNFIHLPSFVYRPPRVGPAGWMLAAL